MSKFICLPLLFLASAISAQPPLTPSGVSKLINEKGAFGALQQIYENDHSWPELLHGIATGTKSWLSIAKTLRAVSDAGASEQLDLAVGEALEHRPENVLRFAVPAFSLEAVCGGPDVDDARFDSYELSIRAITKRKEMVRRIDAPALRRPRNRCIQELEKSKAGIAYFYGKTNRLPN